MDKALIVEIADDITAALTAAEIPAETRLVFEARLCQTKTLKCVTVPHSLTSSIIARNPIKERIAKIDLAIMKQATENELGALLIQAEQIADLLEGKRLPSGLITGVEFSPIYDAEAWLQFHAFLSVLVFTVKVFQK